MEPDHSQLRKEAPLDQFDFEERMEEKLPEYNSVLWFGIISVVIPGLIGIILGVMSITKGNHALRLHEENPNRYTPESLSSVKWGRGLSIFGFAFRGLLIVIIIAVLAIGG